MGRSIFRHPSRASPDARPASPAHVPDAPVTRTRWLITLVSFAGAVGASIWLVWSSWPQQGGSLVLPWSAHLLAAGAAISEVTLRAIKIALSARAIGVPLTVWTALRVSLGGDFGAAVTPARSGAEPARFLIMAEARTPVAGAVLVLWLELVLEMLSLATIAVVIALFFKYDAGGAVKSVVAVIGAYAATVLGASAFGIALSRNNANGPPPRWAARVGLHAGRWRTIQRSLRQLRDGVGRVRGANKALMFGSYVSSALHVAFRLCVLPALVLTSFPEVPFERLVAWPLALLYGAAVVPAPGGGGAVELAFKQTLGETIPVAIFGAALVWWRFYTFYVYIVAGALVAGSAVMRALRKKGEEGPVGAALAAADAPAPPRRGTPTTAA